MDMVEFKEKFLNTINTKVSIELKESVIAPIISFVGISDSTSLKFCEYLLVDLSNLSPKSSLNDYSINTIRFFFKTFGDLIRSYLYVASEEMVIKFRFQNKEIYHIFVTKYPAELEIRDTENRLVTVIKFN